MGVDRATVRKALHRLQNDGLVRTGNRGERYLAKPMRGSGDLMQHTVALIGSAVGSPRAGHAAPGWADQLTQAAHRQILSRKLHVITVNADQIAEGGVNALLDSPPRGAILADVFDRRHSLRDMAQALHDRQVPVVVYGDDPELSPFHRVVSDHNAGCRMLTRWLLDQGRRRPMMFAEADSVGYWLDQRRAGHEAVMAEAGLAPRPMLSVPPVNVSGDPAQQFEVRSRLLAAYLMDHLAGPEAVDAILCPSDGQTFYAAAACRRLGKVPGRDVLIVGYDHYWPDSPERRFEQAVPAATVDKDNPRIGQELVNLLLDILEDTTERPDPIRRPVQPQLIVTQSPSGTVPHGSTAYATPSNT